MEDRGSFANRFQGGTPTLAMPDLAAQASAGTTDAYFLGGSDHQGAADSPLRGYVYWRSTDTRRQISKMTDREIQRKIDFLYHHFGFCRRLVHGLAKLCGILTPQPDTLDEDWNEEAFDSFMFVAQSPEIFDQGAHFDFFLSQVAFNVSRFLRGRSLAVMTETGSGRASHAFYEAHQLDHESDENGQTVRQGARVNGFSRHLGYYLRDGGNPEEKPKYFDAQDCLYLGKFENHGQIHPLSILAFAVANMVDVVEVRGAWKSAIKSVAKRGEVIETEPGSTPPRGGGAGSTPVEFTASDGSKQVYNRRLIYGGSEVLSLPPGQKLKVVKDDRPTAENLAFEKAVLEDCVMGVDLPPQALFHIAGVTGPGIRFVMEDIERWILLQHLWQARKCQAIYARTIAKEIKAGRLREPVHPKTGAKLPWWRPGQTHWFGLPSMTIDRGRDARMSVIRLDVGLTTWADEHSKEGAFWKKEIKARTKEVAFAKLCVWEESKLLAEETGGEMTLAYEEVIKRPNTSMLITEEAAAPSTNDPAQ
jgi:hypothetical protein